MDLQKLKQQLVDNNGDDEAMHCIVDNAREAFIVEIKDKKFSSLEEIKAIAEELENLINGFKIEFYHA